MNSENAKRAYRNFLREYEKHAAKKSGMSAQKEEKKGLLAPRRTRLEQGVMEKPNDGMGSLFSIVDEIRMYGRSVDDAK